MPSKYNFYNFFDNLKNVSKCIQMSPNYKFLYKFYNFFDASECIHMYPNVSVIKLSLIIYILFILFYLTKINSMSSA